MNLRHTSVPEIIDAEICNALNKPGLQHIRSKVEVCDGGGEVSGKIDYFIAGRHSGVSLLVNSDKSFVLIAPDEPRAVSWTAEEATPERVTDAVISALCTAVRAAA